MKRQIDDEPQEVCPNCNREVSLLHWIEKWKMWICERCKRKHRL